MVPEAADLGQRRKNFVIHPPRKILELETLKIFCAVAEERSVTRAAARLGRVPSNVSTRIQQLEADMGVELFVRTGKRMSLSTSGEYLVGYAQRLLALAEETKHVVTEGRYGGMLPDYPIACDAGKARHQAAAKHGNNEYAAHWAGQAAPLARELAAAELVRKIVDEWHSAEGGVRRLHATGAVHSPQ